MEFDKKLVERFLKTWNFDISDELLDNIQHVPMHEYRIASKNKNLLFVENLQCCIGLYAFGNDFAFAAHVNTVVFDKNEYKLNDKNEPICCNRCYDLLHEILNYKQRITEPFKIGISLGVRPLNIDEKSMSLIIEGINDVIEKLKRMNIPVIILNTIHEPIFIVDSINDNLITPTKKNHFIK